jgi:ATP-dependent Zn protease
MTGDSDLRATAYHEAGHAVVAWSLGLEVQSINIRADDAGGGADIRNADHLQLVDQVAVIVAGSEAEDIFDYRAHELANLGDLGMLVELLEEMSEEEAALLRSEGHARARDLLIDHKAKVIRLAERLVEVHRIDAPEFLRLMSQLPV